MDFKEVEPLIPIVRFFRDLEYCDVHSEEKRELFKEIESLRTSNGEEYFSLPEYTTYVFSQLESAWKELSSEKSTIAFSEAVFMVKGFLNEWTSILICLLDTAVTIDSDLKTGFDTSFRTAITDFQNIFNRLKTIIEFAYDLAYTGQIPLNDENTDSIE